MSRFCALLLLWLAVEVGAEEILVFGVYAADKPTAVVRRLRPRLMLAEEALTRRLGRAVRIRMRIAATYAKGLDDLIKGRVDFARLGPASYVEAKSRAPRLRVLAVESRNGRKIFRGIIAVHRDSSIRRVSDLRARRFAFGDRRSTIGRYLAQQYLLRHGIRADDLAGFEYLGRHDKVGWAVALGYFDAGALKESTFTKLVAQKAPLRALASFHDLTKPWVAAASMDDARFQVLRQALLDLGPDHFLPGNDRDFDPIRETIAESARFFVD